MLFWTLSSHWIFGLYSAHLVFWGAPPPTVVSRGTSPWCWQEPVSQLPLAQLASNISIVNIILIKAKLWVCTKSSCATTQSNCKLKQQQWHRTDSMDNQRVSYQVYWQSNGEASEKSLWDISSLSTELFLWRSATSLQRELWCFKMHQRERTKHRSGSVSVWLLWNELFCTVNNSSRIQVRPVRKHTVPEPSLNERK